MYISYIFIYIYTFIAFPHAWNLTISRFNSSTVLPSHMPCLKVSIHFATVSQQWLVADQIYIIANSFVSRLMYLRGSGKFIERSWIGDVQRKKTMATKTGWFSERPQEVEKQANVVSICMFHLHLPANDKQTSFTDHGPTLPIGPIELKKPSAYMFIFFFELFPAVVYQ